MPKQDFTLLDYTGPIVVAIIFAIVLLLISFFIINFYCITPKDDFTVFEKLGAKVNMRMGPHKLIDVKRGGYASTYALEHEIEDKHILMPKQSFRIIPVADHA